MKKILIMLVLISLAASAQVRRHSKLGLKVSRTATGHSVSLSGCSDTTPGVSFNFYRGTSAGGENTTALNASPLATCSYIDTTVTALNTYFYVAKAFLSTASPQLSGPSNEVTAAIPADPQPAAPTGLTVGTVALNKVPLKWKAPVKQLGVDVNSYNIMRCYEATCPGPPKVGETIETMYLDTCTYPKVCYYEITANDTAYGKNVITKSSNIVEAKIN
jgi:hypothetical protein